MQVLLVHNPASGDGTVDADELCRAVRRAGHEVRYVDRDDDWTSALRSRPDLVVAAGGDGTVRDVLVGVHGLDVPVAILPLGTANNVARALDIPTDDPVGAIATWDATRHRWFDVPVASGAAGTLPFVEALGGGTFADLLRAADRAEEAGTTAGGLGDARTILLDLLRAEPPARRWAIRVDGEDVSADHAAVEVVNTGHLGPRVRASTASDPGDGVVEVVALDQRALAELADRLEAAAPDEVVRLDGARWCGRTVEVSPPRGTTMHVDDEVLDDRTEGSWRVAVGPHDRVRVLR